MWDGAEIVVPNKEHESVRQEIGHFIVGRCRNSDSWIRKTRASDKKSGILLRDGAGIVVLDKENGSVRQEIRHFIVGRCRKRDYGQGKRERPTRNQAFY